MMMMEVDLHAPGTLHALSVGIFLGIVVAAIGFLGLFYAGYLQFTSDQM
jgi:hypothetical protein